MEIVKQYIEEILGDSIKILNVPSKELGAVLPFFMIEMYSFCKMQLMNNSVLLFEPKQQNELSILQLSKHQELIEEKLHCKSAVVLQEIESFQRKRLIEKRVQFIVPGKQLFLPFSFIDLKEDFSMKREKRETLSPSSQMILLWYLLDHNTKIDFRNKSFKELAFLFDYSAMTITKTADELLSHGLCELVENGKEKFIYFNLEKHNLWNDAQPYLVDPVLKTFFVDELPNSIGRVKSNQSALAEYTEMNPSRQKYYAIDKTVYYGLKNTGAFKESNKREGNYCIEVWKYNPNLFMEILPTDEFAVDPLSLYLNLKNNPDERTDYALENLIDHIW